MSALSASFSVNTINDSDDEEMMKQAQGSGQWSGLATIHNQTKPSVNDGIVIGSWNMAQPVLPEPRNLLPGQDSQMEDAQSSLEDPYFDMGDAEGEAMKGEKGKGTELAVPSPVNPLNDVNASPEAEHGGASKEDACPKQVPSISPPLVGTEAMKAENAPPNVSSVLGGSPNRKGAPILDPVVPAGVAHPKVASVFATPPLKRSLVVEFQSPASKNPDSTNQEAAGSGINSPKFGAAAPSDSTLELPNAECEASEENKKRKLMTDPKFAKGTKMGDLSPASQETLKQVRRWRAVENSNKWHSTFSSKGVKKGDAVDEGQQGEAVDEGQEGGAVDQDQEDGGQEGHAVEGEGAQPNDGPLSMEKILQTENVEDLKRINLSTVRVSWCNLVCAIFGFCQTIIAFEFSTSFECFKKQVFVPQRFLFLRANSCLSS